MKAAVLVVVALVALTSCATLKRTAERACTALEACPCGPEAP